ncbi:hypothetical protein GCWU000342_01645 [Shuttleworthella satelles DSM 14600]|uniref:Uncharacterized protein n=1 Tax=Shuttleworthella satelles DSM 14600 TaxID=626523 RepID=C4GCF2_9FIRM|nr:hypothetical protein GCWU000342_01645 [Shuttleworthia satelles DSM 14600]
MLIAYTHPKSNTKCADWKEDFLSFLCMFTGIWGHSDSQALFCFQVKSKLPKVDFSPSYTKRPFVFRPTKDSFPSPSDVDNVDKSVYKSIFRAFGDPFLWIIFLSRESRPFLFRQVESILVQADDLQFVLPSRLTDCVQSHFKQDQRFSHVFDRLLAARNLSNQLIGEIKNGFCAFLRDPLRFDIFISGGRNRDKSHLGICHVPQKQKRGRGIRKVRLPHPQLR